LDATIFGAIPCPLKESVCGIVIALSESVTVPLVPLLLTGVKVRAAAASTSSSRSSSSNFSSGGGRRLYGIRDASSLNESSMRNRQTRQPGCMNRLGPFNL
jgi:hypothetical protein